ncbi:FMN-binding protein [Ulvibacter sp. MAR_2010_11]|uniref:FMN-binding protein n=1 Tax=Ulvibacter sp. MAR_2010_11 TaxID=1250229 RepID=UPI000C2BAA34|nr:FMN-binding protein [Ulvibacter sp. MAR_2010_11]PKA82070.1 FMN-binding protein [Ulvibacter sp. MAR_2010_11]
MLKQLFFILILTVVSTAFTIPSAVLKKADKEIMKFYEIEKIQKEIIAVPKDINSLTASEFGDGNLFKIRSNGQFLGYGYIGNAPSKTATFDYLVLFDTNLIITKSKVLIYREEYGGEISSRRWLQQFDGVSPASKELKYNDDIIPISGATISVRSMTKAMNELLQSIAMLQKRNVL